MSTHTPGPWTAEGERIHGCPPAMARLGLHLATARDVDGTRATLDANARLIAAAPDMDALLRRVTRDVEQWPGKREHNMALNAVSEFITKAEEGS